MPPANFTTSFGATSATGISKRPNPCFTAITKGRKLNALTVLNFVLDEILKLMHPFIPFVTEEIYQYKQTGKCHALMMQEWPKYNKKFNYYKEAKAFEGVMDIIKAIRNVRNEMQVAPSKKIKVYVKAGEHAAVVENFRPISKRWRASAKS